MSRTTAAIIGAIGRTLIVTGVLVLAFAGFQLWGTSVLEARAQDALDTEFESAQADYQARLAELTTTTESSPTTAAPSPTTTTPDDVEATTTTAAPILVAPELAAELLPEQGEALGRIVIPSIGVDKGIVEGVRRDDLRAGPGHYPETPLPGQPGNAAIAGHRTTYGSPFGDLDLLVPGDLIEVETLQGTFFYEVEAHTDADGNELGHFIVTPDRVDVLDDMGDNRLTLTACHPKRSAAQRIVVTARLTSPPAPVIESSEPVSSTEPEVADDGIDPEDDPVLGTDDAPNLDEDPVADGEALDSLGWQPEEAPSTAVWAAITALVAVAAWLLGRLWRRWPAYLLATPPFLGALFVCFIHLDRLIPAF